MPQPLKAFTVSYHLLYPKLNIASGVLTKTIEAKDCWKAKGKFRKANPYAEVIHVTPSNDKQ